MGHPRFFSLFIKWYTAHPRGIPPPPYIFGQKFENREVIPVFACPIFRIAKWRGVSPQRRRNSMWNGMNGLRGMRKKNGLTAAEMGIE